QEQPETVKPGAVSLPHLAEGNFRTTPVQTVQYRHTDRRKTVAPRVPGRTAGTTPAVYGCPGGENSGTCQYGLSCGTAPSTENRGTDGGVMDSALY
ncbi:conjugal transfer protein TraV, partial [Salmonella enterica subsp. enterica serovar Enteritidis str. CDC_2010K_1795]